MTPPPGTPPPEVPGEPVAPPLPAPLRPFEAAFPTAELGITRDGIPSIRVAPEALLATLRVLRDDLGYIRFIDITAGDDTSMDPRFEVQYLLYSRAERR